MIFKRIQLLTLAASLLVSSTALCQLSISSYAVDTREKQCDDYASMELNDPWDMKNSSDINNFTTQDVVGFSNITWADDLFYGVVNANSTAAFYLLSPEACWMVRSSGRHGQDYPIDTSKYTRLVIRMYTDTIDPGGIKLLFPRGCDHGRTRTVSTFYPTQVGWHTYTIDLNSLSISTSESTDTRSWSEGSITGIGIMPHTQTGAVVAVDWIRLEDPTSCSSANVNYTANAVGGKNRVNLYLDDDTTPYNGYVSKIASSAVASGAASASVDIGNLSASSYRVVGVLDADYATLERDNPWDMNESTDITATAGISGGTFSGGSYSGTTGSDPTIYLKNATSLINAATYRYLSLRLTRSASGPLIILWNDGAGAYIINPGDPQDLGGGLYQLDLGAVGGWSGTISNLIIRPTNASGVNFSLDFVSLRTSGYDNDRDVSSLSASAVASTGRLVVNNPPLISIQKPNRSGGESLRPWNMKSGDFVVYSNLRNDTDTNRSDGEPFSAYLPDVRTVDGIRGDFFKGTNALGVDDPVNYSTFPIVSSTNPSPLSINADQYKHLCFKMLIDHEFNLCLGSIARPIWLNSNGTFTEAAATPIIWNRWGSSRWYEGCLDLSAITLQSSAYVPWSGQKSALRLDPHEFSKDACDGYGAPSGNSISVPYYFDYIKLRKDLEADSQFAILYNLSDSDDAATVNFYYNTSASTSGGTLINGSPLGENSRYLLWDTSALPNGRYYIYAVATDGLNTTKRLAWGSVVVSHDGRGVRQSPILSLDSPTTGYSACNTIQVKGYAIQPDRYEDISGVEVQIDGQVQGMITPSLYSPRAVQDYPALDSSSSGFNTSYDVSTLSPGAHTISLRAISSDGASTSQDISFQKVSSGCSPEVSDADPAGRVVGINVEQAAPTPTIDKIKIDKKNLLSVQVGTVGDAGCVLTLYAGQKKEAVTTQVGQYTITSAEASSTKLKLKVKNVTINGKKLKSFSLKAAKSCTGYTASQSSVKTLKIKATSTGKIKTFAKLLPKLRGLKR